MLFTDEFQVFSVPSLQWHDDCVKYNLEEGLEQIDCNVNLMFSGPCIIAIVDE